VKAHRGESVVRDVLDAVREEIAKVGFSAMRIENVALRAEVAKTTIYRRWPKKEDLLFELLQSMTSGSGEIPESGSLRTDLVAVARHLRCVMTSTDGQAIARVLMAERSEPEVQRAIAHVRERKMAVPLKIVERARERGEIGRAVDADLLLTTLAGAIPHRAFMRSEELTDAYLEALIDMLIAGVRPRASTETA
jgi:AcrR family transcriptional regulator